MTPRTIKARLASLEQRYWIVYDVRLSGHTVTAVYEILKIHGCPRHNPEARRMLDAMGVSVGTRRWDRATQLLKQEGLIFFYRGANPARWLATSATDGATF